MKPIWDRSALCAARLAQLEMIRPGTTCFADPASYFSAETAQAVKESGMREMIARTVFDMGQTTMGNLPKGFFEPTDEVRLDPKVLRPERAVEMLTINGARCMQWDRDLGSLEVGKKADVMHTILQTSLVRI
jgi:cytosine/adenosine deaminase-related metal-dependent hydrolase